MPQIRPVSDLCNRSAEISRMVHENDEPVILTQNGHEDMVVLSYKAYEKLQCALGAATKLRVAEVEAETTNRRYSHEEVMAGLRGKLKAEEINR